MPEKMRFEVPPGDAPEFLKASHKKEVGEGFVQLSDVIEGFSGTAKMSRDIWRAMFPQGMDVKERVARVKKMKEVLKERPDAIFEDVSDLLLLGIPVSESDIHFKKNEKPFSPSSSLAPARASALEGDLDPTRAISSLRDLDENPTYKALMASKRARSGTQVKVSDSDLEIPVEEDLAGVLDDGASIPVEESLEESDDDKLLKARDEARQGYLAGRLRADTPIDERPFDLATAKSPFSSEKQVLGSELAGNVPPAEASQILDRSVLQAALRASSGRAAKSSGKRV